MIRFGVDIIDIYTPLHIHIRCKQAEKPAAQTAHLVFSDTKANT